MILKITFLVVLIIGTIEDIQTHKITLRYLVMAGIMGLVIHLFQQDMGIVRLLLGLLVGGFMAVLSVITDRKIGMGDGLLVAVCGIFFGIRKTILILWVALILSAVVSLGLLVKKKGKDYELPFVPFILVAYIGMICYGQFR
ncbi:MAG: prepilin peptidase [Lachnospiraceae bacterium]